MLYTTLTMFGSVVLGAGLFRWYDLFHLAVGLTLLVLGGGLVALCIAKRAPVEVPPGMPQSGPAPELGRQLLLGLLGGGLTLLMLAGAFWGSTRVGLKDLFYGQDCSAVLAEVRTLAKRQSYAGLVQLVTEQPLQQMSAACRKQLTEQHVRALMSWAAQATAAPHVDKLQQALQAAQSIPHPDLIAVLTTKLENVAQQQALHEQQQVLATQQQTIATQARDLAQQQHLLTGQQQEISALKVSLTRLLLARMGEITPVQETPEGEVMIPLSETAIRFDSGQAQLTPAAMETLRKIVALLNQESFKQRHIRVEGHADNTGSATENDLLSEARAQQVAQVLEHAGISAERLQKPVGHGSRRPLGPNDTPEGRQRNRRVEIIIGP